MIRLDSVRKGFNMGKPNEFVAVQNASMTLEENKVTVLKGPSGSGKTTLLSLIGCMTRPTSGRISLKIPVSDGGATANGDNDFVDVTSLPERFLTDIRQRNFGFIFQQFNLIRGITILENIMLPAYPVGLKRRFLNKRATELLEIFNLRNRASAKVEWLSGGEMQRVAIARALMNDPAIIIADEPTAHLDSHLSLDFMNIVATLKNGGKTVILASHDPLVFNSQCINRIITVRDGVIGEEET
jgi:putative ABC transport system ATP-binding protein